MDDEQWGAIWKRRCDLLARTELSALYHRRRERFYSVLDKWAKAIAVICGSVSITDVMPPWLRVSTGVAIAVTSGLSLVFAFADKARLHADLAARFLRLESAVHACGMRCNDDDAAKWEAQLAEIEALEPPVLSVLVRMCQNDMAWAKGQPHRVYKISRLDRLLAHWIDRPTKHLDPVGS